MSETICRLQEPFGRLEWDDYLGWWQSGQIRAPMFRHQPVRWCIPSEPADDPMAPIASDTIAAAHAFLALDATALEAVRQHAFRYYLDIKESWADCPEVRMEEVWRHVRPNGVTVDRRDEDDLVYVSVECECAWEPEHGLQLVLQSGARWTRVSDYSGHLTDGDAYGRPELDHWMRDPVAILPVRTTRDFLAR